MERRFCRVGTSLRIVRMCTASRTSAFEHRRCVRDRSSAKASVETRRPRAPDGGEPVAGQGLPPELRRPDHRWGASQSGIRCRPGPGCLCLWSLRCVPHVKNEKCELSSGSRLSKKSSCECEDLKMFASSPTHSKRLWRAACARRPERLLRHRAGRGGKGTINAKATTHLPPVTAIRSKDSVGSAVVELHESAAIDLSCGRFRGSGVAITTAGCRRMARRATGCGSSSKVRRTIAG